MADMILCEREDLVAIADAVREQTGTINEMTLNEMPANIYSIRGGRH